MRWSQRVAARIDDMVDNPSVAFAQSIIYGGYLASGVHSIILWKSPNAVGRVLGSSANVVWIILLVAAPILFWIGVRWAKRNRLAGQGLQLVGNFGVASATATYIAAVQQSVFVGNAGWALWVASSLLICTSLVCIADLHIIRRTRLEIVAIEAEQGGS